ncbi:Transcription elongation factor SPT6 [Scedosporium apiospermum]|uniref:Transcription elongation factor Spt6 n=1 Tax=Pseudallescheria apiosperma TaxID=563466 RepID=A0A084GCT1_PSEDA|nr:Transcription elongation factor SPT6 [Scedosporium apiospermum]KEZ45143.1 Transcription elongation factor SPT6 [Scedosporium apiospermum]
MSNEISGFIDSRVEVDSEEEDESFDEETGSPRRRRTAHIDDSSEEEEEDDEEEERKVREGFIVEDEEEEEEVEEDEEAEERQRRKRARRDREEEERLDEEDLELIGEQLPGWERGAPSEPKFKRLKRGHHDDEDRRTERRGLDEIFSDDEEDADHRPYGRSTFRAQPDEFADFIEEDFPESEEEIERQRVEREVARTRDKGVSSVIDTSGLDKDALQDMEDIFGDGADYDWALQAEEEEEEREQAEQAIELKDVFEPSQLTEKLLTDADNEIRFTDEPERFQIDRKLFKHLQMTGEQFKEEARWISALMWPKKNLPQESHTPFTKAIGKVLEFFVVDEVEVPYVFQHRKDYLLDTKKVPNPDHRKDPDAPEYIIEAKKLLNQDDLWRILELDIKFRSLIERRNALEKMYDNLKTNAGVQDDMLEDMIPQAATVEELQDLQDYTQFRYSAELRELASVNGNSQQTKRPGSRTAMMDRIRKSRAYGFVRSYGLSADQLARNALGEGRKVIPEDDAKDPDQLADDLVDDDFPTGDSVLSAARQMYAEELFVNPRMRKFFRMHFYQLGEIDCHRTDKGLRKIDESHPYYDIKYLMRQTMSDLARQPELFLKMMKAEEDGLIEVKLRLRNRSEFREKLDMEFESENFSDLAQRWRNERKKVLDLACSKLERIITKGVKESLRTACQEEVLNACREEYYRRLDQAPIKPKGLVLGTTPRVLVLSNGLGDAMRDPVFWTWVEEDGRILEHGKFTNLGRDEKQREEFAELVQRRRPDVIGISGFSAATNKLVRDVEGLIGEKRLMGPEYQDPDSDDKEYRTDPLEVVVVNDEVARLYKDSTRAVADHPSLHPIARYCFALARYMQNPMKEYAALGKDIASLNFHSCQKLLPHDKLMKTLETAMVDMVNLCGIDINEAVNDSYTANLLPYIAGLGPRKATSVLKAINANGGVVNSRDELVGDPDSKKLPVVGPRVWNNCASFLYIEYDPTDPHSDPLDNTRVHPEDYELGRKMAADALELDEEDVKAEIDENGPGAVVRKLFKEEEQERVNELILEEYAEQLESSYSQKKRATLETIRLELQAPYEEIRKQFLHLTPIQIFTMFTGETEESLARDMIVPVNVRVVREDFAIVKLDCGVEGRVEGHEISARHSVRDVLQVGQTTNAKVLEVNHKDFAIKLTMREEALRRPYRKPISHHPEQWDYELERQDREELKEKDRTTGRAQRVINHPLFKPFNGMEAEQYLGSQPVGEVVIRPSSKGNDHLAVTWKVADGVYQHLDVLELQKENEFSVGRTLRVGGKFTYTDLDELIVEHVKSMVKKVEQLTQHEKFHKVSRAALEKWLTTYMDANPNRSTYAFCLDTNRPGYFFLCFKSSKSSPVVSWVVKVIPHAYQMLGSEYPDMRALCNGFKLRHQNEVKLQMQKHVRR